MVIEIKGYSEAVDAYNTKIWNLEERIKSLEYEEEMLKKNEEGVKQENSDMGS